MAIQYCYKQFSTQSILLINYANSKSEPFVHLRPLILLDSIIGNSSNLTREHLMLSNVLVFNKELQYIYIFTSQAFCRSLIWRHRMFSCNRKERTTLFVGKFCLHSFCFKLSLFFVLFVAITTFSSTKLESPVLVACTVRNIGINIGSFRELRA